MFGKVAWKAAGASVAGPSHLAEGSVCEDAHSITVAADGYIVGVVSDGAGSAAFGGIAARLICDELPSLLREAMSGSDPKHRSPKRRMARMRRAVIRAVEQTRLSLLRLADLEGYDPDELLATLVAVVAERGTGGVLIHIGDGAAICFDSERRVLSCSEPENGEYYTTTYFLVEENWKSHLRLKFFPECFTTILLMSDGVTELSFVRNSSGIAPFMPFFEPLCRFLSASSGIEGEAALQDALRSEAAQCKVDDDKTIVWIEAVHEDG